MPLTDYSALRGGDATLRHRVTLPSGQLSGQVDLTGMACQDPRMARKLERFPEELARRSSVYPWHEWLDGDVWELTKGEDFTIKAKSLRTNGQAEARKRGGKLRVAESEDGQRMVIQYVGPRTPEQVQAWAAAGGAEGARQPRQRDPVAAERARLVRAWAKGNGWPDLSDHGRLPREVLEAYDQARQGNVRPIIR